LQQNDPERLLQILVDFYLEDENNLGRVVEIAMEAKVSATRKWARGAMLRTDSR
jgi:hypothetical protein